GVSVCRAVVADAQTELVAAVDPAHAGRDVSDVAAVPGPLLVARDAAELDPGAVDVAVDFTRIESAMSNARWCAASGVHAVIGTSGFGSERLAELRELFPSGGPANCIVAPNFAIGAVLMMRFAELAAPWFETAEIVEIHHDGKVDAPSGTALATAERMGRARQSAGAGPWA